MRKKSWGKPGYISTAKPNIHDSKLMLCIWLVFIVYYELLQTNEIITGNQYRLQLMHLSRELKENGRNTSKETIK